MDPSIWEINFLGRTKVNSFSYDSNFSDNEWIDEYETYNMYLKKQHLCDMSYTFSHLVFMSFVHVLDGRKGMN